MNKIIYQLEKQNIYYYITCMIYNYYINILVNNYKTLDTFVQLSRFPLHLTYHGGFNRGLFLGNGPNTLL